MQAELRFDAGSHRAGSRARCGRAGSCTSGSGSPATPASCGSSTRLGPNIYNRARRCGARGPEAVEHLSRRPTYEFQLEAFCRAVAGGEPPITGVADAIANMEVIDAVYRHAGLEPRQPDGLSRAASPADLF